MSKRFQITEDEQNQIMGLYLAEEPKSNKGQRFCHSGNVKSLEEIAGDDETEDYAEGVRIRKNGVNSLADKLELLKTLRLHSKITDGGEYLASGIMNQLKSFKPYNYFDETKNSCGGAMDKIIELYKENEHGEELVRDIEKVYRLSNVSARAREFLKHGLGIARGK